MANPLTTVAGETRVTVAYPNHGCVVGDYCDILNASPIDNFTSPNGTWQIVEIIDANSFQIGVPGVTMSASITGGGLLVTVGLEIPVGTANPSTGYGWGAGAWGEGTWGTPRGASSFSFSPRQWSFGNFGKVLIACPNNFGLYAFDPSSFPVTRAAIIPTAPTVCSGVVVTSDNIVIAYGSSLDPNTALDGGATAQNLLQWWASAQGDYTNWDVTAIAGPNGSPSVAGNVPEGTRFVGAEDLGNHVTLFWTDTALYAFQYTGSQFVFNVRLAGTECGLIGEQAKVQVEGAAYWMSTHGFKMFNGGVANIPNSQDISEWVISTLRPYFTVKTVAWYNQRYNEVWWAFCPNGSDEPTHYVAVKLGEWFWIKGAFPQPISSATRFTGYDARPLIFGADGDLYQLDNGLDSPDDHLPADWFLESGGFEIANGESHVEISGLAIDMERQSGDVEVEITTYDRTPAAAQMLDQDSATFGPSETIVDLRVSGRVAKLRLSGGGDGADFRLGVPKVLFGPGGSRR
jgi:hypothetical protein